MKKLILVLFLVGIIQTAVKSQGCLPDGITFTSQAEIDSFQVNYPDCSRILGNVRIYGDDITDLSNLQIITYIGGRLKVVGNESLTSLTGLNNITSIGNSLEIMGNEVLTNLSGFENLDSIGGDFHVVSCDSLQDLTGMGNLSFVGGYLFTIRSNNTMVSLSGLENINMLSGNLEIKYNPFLSSLNGLNNLSYIGGYLTISHNDTLTDLSGLGSLTRTGKVVKVIENRNLINLTGLESLDSIVMQGLAIRHNNKLSNLNGINNLRYIGGGLLILDNPILASLSALYNLNYTSVITIGAELWGNNELESLAGLDNVNADSLNWVEIVGNIKLSECAVKSICDLLASSNSNTNFANNYQGCNNNQQVEQACQVGVFHQSSNETQISIFPNPANSSFTFATTDLLIIELNLYDQFGKKILTEFHPQNTIDISIINPGIYFVELVTSKTRFNEKLIIIK